MMMWDNSVIGYFCLMQSRFSCMVESILQQCRSCMSSQHSGLCTGRCLFFSELGSWGPFSSVCQTGVDGRSTLRLFQEMPPGKVAAGHRLVVVVGGAVGLAVFVVVVTVMGLAMFVDFFLLPSDSSATSFLVLASLVRPAE